MYFPHSSSSTRRKTQVTPFNASASNSIVAGVGANPASAQSSLIAPNARSSTAPKVTARPQSLLATPTNIDIPPPSPRSSSIVGGKSGGNNLLKVAEMSLDKTLEILKDFPRQEVIDLWESSNKSGQKSRNASGGNGNAGKVSADILATLMATMREGPGKASCSPNSGKTCNLLFRSSDSQLFVFLDNESSSSGASSVNAKRERARSRKVGQRMLERVSNIKKQYKVRRKKTLKL